MLIIYKYIHRYYVYLKEKEAFWVWLIKNKNEIDVSTVCHVCFDLINI